MRTPFLIAPAWALFVCAAVAPTLADEAATGDGSARFADFLANRNDLDAAGLDSYWTARLPLSEGESVRQAWLVDENLYVVTSWSALYAIQAETGLLRWANKITDAAFRVYKPTHFNDDSGRALAVVASTSKIQVIDRYSGDTVREFVSPFAEGSAYVGSFGLLFGGSSDGRFRALQIPSRALPRLITLWEVAVGSPVTATPVIDHRGQVVFASHGGRVFACSALDKVFDWSFAAGGPITADLAIDRDGVYVADEDRSLYRLEANSGAQVWRARFPEPLRDAPALIPHTVYQYCLGHGVSAIDAETGSVRWRVPEGRYFAAHHREHDAIVTTGGKLLMVDHITGATKAAVAAGDVNMSVANTESDAVYLLAGDGRVECVRPDTVPYLRRQQILAAKRQLNVQPGEAATTAPSATASTTTETEDDPFRSRWDRKPAAGESTPK